ncbi:NADPH:quinone oxidoreductase family protein [Pseudorhodoplanes sp.]|uniref:NADPH:quinone oxidoreductase family protein n=1 Tax=Pseudorhodoplanes sp. TaxID=1934341 RepID=UPI002C02B69C|nr:NADPH:quinone oxidoreductase family protein [Pseudorhodoplanes sp.]HWV51639.1 NADPH:quinone oxidoreductase family protein [Pseudorhodoplanes sp.]
MKAVRCHQWGSPDVLAVEDVDTRAPGPGEVRIRVEASAVNFTDTLIVAGKYQFKPKLPHIPGHELSGTVIEIGDGVTTCQVGDRVMASARHGGGFAEEYVGAAERIYRIPDNMSFEAASGFIIGYGTAYFALTYRGQLQPGETLLVNGAAGGAGLAAIQIAKALGARVIACASTPDKVALAAAYGADCCINYTSESVRDRAKEFTEGRGVDVVFDPVGGSAFEEAMRTVGWHARMLIVGFASGTWQQIPANIVLVKNISVMSSLWGGESERDPDFARTVLNGALALYRDGRLKALPGKTYALKDAPDALRDMMNRKVLGKSVVLPRA